MSMTISKRHVLNLFKCNLKKLLKKVTKPYFFNP
jgi:hypothetical protein